MTYKSRYRGALLSLPNGGRREDVIRTKVFEDYIRDHIVNWFTWAQKNELGVGRMEELILVTGCTLVSSWAIATFVDNTTEAEISLASRSFSNGGASFVWSNIRGSVVYHNCCYDSVSFPAQVYSACADFSLLYGKQNPPTTQDQCVFIRGFRAWSVLFLNKPIRDAAEPLPGDRRDDEIQVTRVSGALKVGSLPL